MSAPSKKCALRNRNREFALQGVQVSEAISDPFALHDAPPSEIEAVTETASIPAAAHVNVFEIPVVLVRLPALPEAVHVSVTSELCPEGSIPDAVS